jgi:CheY-like chemotaxis protein
MDIIRLLAADSGFDAHAVDAKPDSRTKTSAPRILVVDDEKLVADSLSEILKRFHYDAVPFYSGETAIEAARQECPDFVLSDVMMPKLNGVETVLKIREICPRTRVLLLSGNAATADLLRQARAEGHEFELLAKPIHPEELLRRLH